MNKIHILFISINIMIIMIVLMLPMNFCFDEWEVFVAHKPKTSASQLHIRQNKHYTKKKDFTLCREDVKSAFHRCTAVGMNALSAPR